ncbi:hypothetical protein BCR34DRAFT_291630 [Clohesyomyces aquaticus]|uniref:Uncharacterized protein n=1 Tax=Clohesyomyces aquaticus TaxID=1231657 RepID=A0A1Y2A836_9PLEO|nr:hypothetical protein BCR34DRAFT_291630 [Clohesyomyces aquaticus]
MKYRNITHCRDGIGPAMRHFQGLLSNLRQCIRHQQAECWVGRRGSSSVSSSKPRGAQRNTVGQRFSFGEKCARSGVKRGFRNVTLSQDRPGKPFVTFAHAPLRLRAVAIALSQKAPYRLRIELPFTTAFSTWSATHLLTPPGLESPNTTRRSGRACR